jgi:putative endonuclease
MQNHFYLYILKCINGVYYVGHTDNIDQRMSQHNLGLINNCYTKNKRPVELVYLQDFPTRDAAFSAERQIKGWSRKKKEAFIKGDWKEIQHLNLLQKTRYEAFEDTLQQVQGEREEALVMH